MRLGRITVGPQTGWFPSNTTGTAALRHLQGLPCRLRNMAVPAMCRVLSPADAVGVSALADEAAPAARSDCRRRACGTLVGVTNEAFGPLRGDGTSTLKA